MSAIQPQRILRGREHTFGRLMMLLVVGSFLWVVPQHSAHAFDCSPFQGAYLALDAHIDEVWTSEEFDCAVLEPEISADATGGSIYLSLDVANACGEELLVVANQEGASGERVGDGELVTVRADAVRLAGESEGEAELEFYVITESDRLNNAPEPAPHRSLARIRYSYTGSPHEDEGEGACGGDTTFFGCATSNTGSDAPVAPLTLIGVALAGMVVLRRRSSIGQDAESEFTDPV